MLSRSLDKYTRSIGRLESIRLKLDYEDIISDSAHDRSAVNHAYDSA